MENKTLEQLYKTKDGRYYLLLKILEKDNLSIVDIVRAKEDLLNCKIENKNILISGLALRSTMMFSKHLKKAIEQVKPLVAKDIIESGVIGGTPMEKTLVEYLYKNGIVDTKK